jgi:hypothetical protein
MGAWRFDIRDPRGSLQPGKNSKRIRRELESWSESRSHRFCFIPSTGASMPAPPFRQMQESKGFISSEDRLFGGAWYAPLRSSRHSDENRNPGTGTAVNRIDSGFGRNDVQWNHFHHMGCGYTRMGDSFLRISGTQLGMWK